VAPKHGGGEIGLAIAAPVAYHKETEMEERPGCLSGLLKLAFLNWIFDWLQEKFGFGRGVSCTGCGCGIILLLIFLALACSVVTGTDWFNLGF
jgi:hypothetical protein